VLPGGALLVKVDEDDGSISPIEGAEINGSVATYTLTDQGEFEAPEWEVLPPDQQQPEI
jgi:hypothetical protein